MTLTPQQRVDELQQLKKNRQLFTKAAENAMDSALQIIADLRAEIQRKDELLAMALSYIAYVKENDSALHDAADGTPSIEAALGASA